MQHFYQIGLTIHLLWVSRLQPKAVEHASENGLLYLCSYITSIINLGRTVSGRGGEMILDSGNWRLACNLCVGKYLQSYALACDKYTCDKNHASNSFRTFTIYYYYYSSMLIPDKQEQTKERERERERGIVTVTDFQLGSILFLFPRHFENQTETLSNWWKIEET
jgi:hypothetical protein